MNLLRERARWLAMAGGAAVLLGIFVLRPARDMGGRTDERYGSGIQVLAVGGLAAVGALLWWRKRRRTGELDGPGRLQLVERIRLEPGKTLHLVEVDECRLLLTATEQGLRLLARLDENGTTGTAGRASAEREEEP